MKGFFSILYLIFVIAIAFSLFTYYQNLFSLNKRNEIDFIKFETYSNRETDLKNFIVDTIKHELENVRVDETSDEIVERIGEKLSKLENYENWYKGNFNFDVDFWCGYVTASERKSLSREMIDQKMAIKCEDCEDFDNITWKVKYENGEIKRVNVRSCTKFLSYSNSIEISEDDRVIWNGTKVGTPSLGISIYDKNNGIASIVIFAEGTKIKKGWKD
jgi:hypothetical protein